ncbi:response regulator [Xanthobacter sediminis]|uniref:hypothetical protein n=1 Tax=Xanthobacter sediminis TaxID=3119926 RepID=UPI003729F192
MRLLREWADARGVTLHPFDPAATGDHDMSAGAGQRWALGILNLGGLAMDERTATRWINSLLSRFPDTPLVVLSDRDDDGEAVRALRMGARGFIHTGTAPEVAMNALSFIMGGGTFFPPGALIAQSRRTGISGRLFGRRRPRTKGSVESLALPGTRCAAAPGPHHGGAAPRQLQRRKV